MEFRKTRICGSIPFASIIPVVLVLLLVSGAHVFSAQRGARADLRIAREIVDREPVGEGNAFPAEVGQLAAWTRITGAENTVIEHVWRYGDSEWIVPLDIGSPRWRTWSRKTILPQWTGNWEVEIRDGEGNSLATATFTVGGN